MPLQRRKKLKYIVVIAIIATSLSLDPGLRLGKTGFLTVEGIYHSDFLLSKAFLLFLH